MIGTEIAKYLATVVSMFVLYYAFQVYKKVVYQHKQRDCEHKWENQRICKDCELRQKEVEAEHEDKDNMLDTEGKSGSGSEKL